MHEQRKILAGRVTSTKMQKTVVVEVELKRAHPLYHKIVRKVKSFLAHDEEERCQEGDMVIQNPPVAAASAGDQIPVEALLQAAGCILTRG